MTLRTYATPGGLASALRSHTVSPLAAPVYLSVATIGQTAFGSPALLSSGATPTTVLYSLLYLVLSLATIWVAFRANGGRQGRDFLFRYFCLALLLWIWVSGIAIIVWYGLYFSIRQFSGPATASAFSHSPASNFAYHLLPYVVFLPLLVRHMRAVSAPQPEPEPRLT